MRKEIVIRLAVAIAVCWIPVLAGSVFTSSAVDSWYRELEKPWFNPPSWVFGPVWSVLYLGMGIALYLIWTHGDRSARWRGLMAVFVLQLALNGAWSLAFFGMESPIAGLIVIMPLLTLILVTIVLAWPFSRIASLLLAPYFLWVSFATLLNYAIWQLN